LLIITSFYSGCSFLPYGNTAPALDSTPPTTAKVEYLYTYDVNANDLEDMEFAVAVEDLVNKIQDAPFCKLTKFTFDEVFK